MEQSIWKAERVPGEVEIEISRSGGGEEPLVALHGITAQHRAFDALARHLGPRGLVGVDLRGRGNSGKPPSGYGMEVHAGDVVRVLDHLGLERAVLVGHSMGGFVGLQTAAEYPDRVEALVLLDGGWPRAEVDPESLSKEEWREAAAVQEGIDRAMSRLNMVFETPEEYLEFWFPGQGLTFRDLPPDLADYYRYDLEEVEGGYSPKALYEAAVEDAGWLRERGLTAAGMEAVRCPVALARASEGFFPGAEPLIPDEARDAMARLLDLRAERLIPGANHYTMMLDPHAAEVYGLVEELLDEL
ncbi:MAG: alpha/beta hydrolase [Rubrobacter sp.]|nr:alpha/beta hydrolase [Rubrobacter sp.]